MSTYLYQVELQDTMDADIINKALCLLPTSKREKIKSFYHKEDTIRSLLGYMMLQKVLKRNQYSNSVCFTKHGKPFIKNHEHFHFNISHSMRWIVLAVSKYKIGVDIEYIRSVCLDSMSEALTKEEYAFLQTLPYDEAINNFFRIWTIKESFLKMIGKGLSISPNRLQTNVYSGSPILTLDGKQQNVTFHSFQVKSHYQLTICISEEDHILKMETLNATELLKDILG